MELQLGHNPISTMAQAPVRTPTPPPKAAPTTIEASVQQQSLTSPIANQPPSSTTINHQPPHQVPSTNTQSPPPTSFNHQPTDNVYHRYSLPNYDGGAETEPATEPSEQPSVSTIRALPDRHIVPVCVASSLPPLLPPPSASSALSSPANSSFTSPNAYLRQRGPQHKSRPIVQFNAPPPKTISHRTVHEPTLNSNRPTMPPSVMSAYSTAKSSACVQSTPEERQRSQFRCNARDAYAHRGRTTKSVVFNGTFPIDEPVSSRFADAEAAGDSASDYDEFDRDEDDDDDDDDDYDGEDNDVEPDDGLGFEAYVEKHPICHNV